MSTIKADNLSNVAGDKSIPVDRVAQGVAAAWVNFNGTGTVAIRAAYNVSSITDNGTGDYTVNFTTPMPDANYAWAASQQRASSYGGNTDPSGDTPVNANFLRLVTGYISTGVVATDMPSVVVVVFR